MTKQWFEYPIVVPFGDIHFDSALGGSHDLDIGAPANYEVTALLPGIISSISAPPWGKQVGIRLDTPYNGVPYMAFLHLSATNPSLSIGEHINKGDLIGWVGGANFESQYDGTSNPTGSNFLNPPFQSSQVQVGIALMRGPEYGTSGWEVFPPVDWKLDPTQIIKDAINALTTNGPTAEQIAEMDAVWDSQLPDNPAPKNTGFHSSWERAYLKGHRYGAPTGWERTIKDFNGKPMQIQIFTGGIVYWRFNSQLNEWQALWYSGSGGPSTY